MYATIPIYYSSLDYAYKNKEEELWRENFKLNLGLKKFVDDQASTAYNTRELDGFIHEIVEIYGVERALYVLGRTIQYKEWDGRFSDVVRVHAEQFHNKKSCHKQDESKSDDSDKLQEYITDIHPIILNQIYRELMKYESEKYELGKMDELELENKEDLADDELDI